MFPYRSRWWLVTWVRPCASVLSATGTLDTPFFLLVPASVTCAAPCEKLPAGSTSTAIRRKLQSHTQLCLPIEAVGSGEL